ncbi:MAG: radical SAM protein, partial [Oscillospiraceae bacterium]|nr:radical SAM protein [Oscillospiraceae bacterium]
ESTVSARREILPIFIPHLGCTHACVFCNQSAITDRDAENALRALDELLSSCAPCSAGFDTRCENSPTGKQDGSRQGRELAFYGGSFTAIPPEQQLVYLEKAKKALDAGLIASVRLSTRPDAIDAETLDRLRRYGVATVELGAQSMQDEVLRMSGRGHTAGDVRRAAQCIREAGFSLGLQMMTGLPGDDDEGALRTARELIRLRPDFVRIYPTVIVRGTALERLWREGSYREHTVEDAVRVCSRLLPLFREAGIPVIRLGLNPTDRLSSGDALAGAYHPALGELVYSRILRNRMEDLLSPLACAGRDAEILVPPARLSQAIGQKKSNLVWLIDRFRPASLRILPAEELTPDGSGDALTVSLL